jgi:hypothetical protein
MRTLDRAYEELLLLDPECGLSKYALRQLFLSGIVPTVEVGKRRLVEMGNLLAYLRGALQPSLTATTQVDRELLRRIPE